MTALSLMIPLYYPSHESVYKDRYCRSQFARSPILRPNRFASLNINVANRPSSSARHLLILPIPSSFPFYIELVLFLSLSLSLSLFSSVFLISGSQLTEAIAVRSSIGDCTQSAANWGMIGGASADSIAPLTTPAVALYNHQSV